MDPVAFTLRHANLTPDLMTPVRIHDAHASNEQVTPDGFLSYDALWDTGAMASVISTEVVKDLNLSPISQCMTYHAQGQSLVNVYMVDMILPNKILVRDIQVTEGHLNGFGMLIGMDIINLGDFALTHKNAGTVFSFQIPSTHEYDFVKQIEQGVGQKKPKKKK
ncbi:MAG: retroviral-like aspartic protease family protein [Bacteroidales bacterium]|nr:retroviral-like aspartic protease family protein [Bacteroidales bacterium]